MTDMSPMGMSPIQQRALALKASLDEAINLGRTGPGGASAPSPSPGPNPPPAGPPGALVQPGGPSIMGGPLPQQIPSSPIMGALQQSEANKRPGMTPANPLAVKKPAPVASYMQGAQVGFARGGRVDLAVRVK